MSLRSDDLDKLFHALEEQLRLVDVRFELDLRALHPTAEELLMAAAWTQTQDPSDGFRAVLVLALRVLGVEVANPDQ